METEPALSTFKSKLVYMVMLILFAIGMALLADKTRDYIYGEGQYDEDSAYDSYIDGRHTDTISGETLNTNTKSMRAMVLPAFIGISLASIVSVLTLLTPFQEVQKRCLNGVGMAILGGLIGIVPYFLIAMLEIYSVNLALGISTISVVLAYLLALVKESDKLWGEIGFIQQTH